MDVTRLPALRRVAVCGGTHGNEMSGVYLVPELEKRRRRGDHPPLPFTLSMVLSNPEAISRCYRYLDKDLNRCFTSAILRSPVTGDSAYEIRRAQELNALLGPKKTTEAVDFLCDLHNTTANMGLTVISYSGTSGLCMHLFKHLQARISSAPVRLFYISIPPDEAYSLESVSKNGISLEVGPQPHGVVRADIFNLMKEAVDAVLDWITDFNSGKVSDGGELEGYTLERSVDYPRDPDTQKISAVIHPELQDKDYSLLRRGDPIFQTFSGETLRYEEEESLHPLFINEAAYYEKGVAFHLARKVTFSIPSIRVQMD